MSILCKGRQIGKLLATEQNHHTPNDYDSVVSFTPQNTANTFSQIYRSLGHQYRRNVGTDLMSYKAHSPKYQHFVVSGSNLLEI